MHEQNNTNETAVVSLEVVWQDSSRKHDARMSELSLKGGHIDCISRASVGELVGFKLRLPSGHWVPFHGKVTYDDYPVGFGFEFIDLTDETRAIIKRVVNGKLNELSAAKPDAARPADRQTAEKFSRILIAEDDMMTLRMLSAIVESLTYKVVTARDGREAFRILQQDSDFNAAVFDMNMPHLDGLDLINYMKTDDRLKGIPVGMVTAEQDPKIWDESIAAGADVFLPKPFSPPQVKMMVNMLVGKTMN